MQDKYEVLAESDPVLGQLIKAIGKLDVSKRNDYYQSLVKSIIGQQLSVKAAATIYERFLKRVDGKVTPEILLSITDDELRSIGISRPKIKYVRDLSQKVVEKEIKLDELDVLRNDEVITALTSVKGIGTWTAEMFLIFSLGREDVLSLLDVGLHRGAKWLYGGEDGKIILEAKQAIWAPYHSIASLYLWETVNRDLVIHYPTFTEFLKRFYSEV